MAFQFVHQNLVVRFFFLFCQLFIYANSLQNSANFGRIVDHKYGAAKTSQNGPKVHQIIMNDGRCLPLVAFGTWQLGNETTVKAAIKTAIEYGYRAIDTAYIYGNEDMIGNILQQLLREGLIQRQELFVTTKVWNNHQSKPSVAKSIKGSLKKLKLTYLDLVLLHYPTGFKEKAGNYPKYPNGTIIPRKWTKNSFTESWEAMEEAVKNNWTRSIGVSNFNRNQMKVLLSKAKIKPVLNQVESHPNLKQKNLLKYLLDNQILMQAYAPIRKADKELLNNPILVEIGQKHNKTSAQVALRWQIQRLVPLVVKSSNPKRIKSNLEIFDFELTPEEMARIEMIEEKERIYDIPGLKPHPDYPFDQE